MRDSFFIILFFAAGLTLTAFELIPAQFFNNDTSLWALWVFMFITGLGIGANRSLGEILKAVRPGILMLPVLTTAGTFLGIIAVCAVFGYELFTFLAVGAGFGYYSLSSILINQYIGGEAGAVSLIANIARELFVLVFAPILYRRFGAEPLICCGGCTTSDTTLPVILKYAGIGWLAPAVFHAMVLDFSVPFWVTFFCSLAK